MWGFLLDSLLTGYRIFHNYARLHVTLDGETLAERAGIMMRVRNKGITLIRNLKRGSYFLDLLFPLVANSSNNAALSEAILSNNSSTDFFSST